jgi:hypothetical protein
MEIYISILPQPNLSDQVNGIYFCQFSQTWCCPLVDRVLSASLLNVTRTADVEGITLPHGILLGDL